VSRTVKGTQMQCDGHWGGDNWGVTVRPGWIPVEFGIDQNLRHFAQLPSSTSRIIWTLGTADPWHVGGVVRVMDWRTCILIDSHHTGAGEDNGIDHNDNWLRFPYVFIDTFPVP
jgi:hypothetical protein